MSASKYRWTPACDGQPCVGDCDLCRVDNLQSGIYTDNPDDTLRYVQTTVPVDLWGNPKLADDYVLVVRCRDCKYWHEDVANFIASITSFPRGACKVVRGLTNGEFYCADGVRKEK